MRDFQKTWEAEQDYIEKILDQTLPTTDLKPQEVHEAMRYSTLGGGKRLRAVLCLHACVAVGGKKEQAAGVAAALEMIHAYSLVHDDLPAMDDDDFRRGKPSNHKVFGEALAILAGDALLTEAFIVLAKLPEKYGVSPERTVRIIKEIAEGIGSQGMIGGQVVDIASESKKMSPNTLNYIHSHKTGALFTKALRTGAILGNCDEKSLQQITRYGENFGLAFQITDDILDLTGTEEQLGKAVGADEKLGKLTYPSLYGLEKSKKMAEDCVEECLIALKDFQDDAWFLRELAKFILKREY